MIFIYEIYYYNIYMLSFSYFHLLCLFIAVWTIDLMPINVLKWLSEIHLHCCHNFVCFCLCVDGTTTPVDENVLPFVLQGGEHTPDSSHDAAASMSATVADKEWPKVWNGRKNRCQKETDDAATLMFIDLVKKNWEQLNDKHTTKNEVWKSIQKEMEVHYNFDTDNTTEKLRLKWRSLWNAYKAYVKECDKTGTGLDTILDTPPFYDEIADIVSSSKAVHLDYVSDTFCPTDQTKWSL